MTYIMVTGPVCIFDPLQRLTEFFRYRYKNNIDILIGPIPLIIVLVNRKDSENTS